MGHTDIKRSTVKSPYQEIKKDKRTSSDRQLPINQSKLSGKNDKNNSWGSVYKNKQNFIDMHLC